MTPDCWMPSLWLASGLLLLAGCASRPINPPIAQADPKAGYRFETHQAQVENGQKDSLAHPRLLGRRHPRRCLFVRRARVPAAHRGAGPKGDRGRLLDQVDIITGACRAAASLHWPMAFTATSCSTDYEQRFLKRDVQGEIVARTFESRQLVKPVVEGLGAVSAARGPAVRRDPLQRCATFDDLQRARARLDPRLCHRPCFDRLAGLVFDQSTFDILCSDLSAVRLSRAAAASSAVPVVLSPVTLTNYGGSCNTKLPDWVGRFTDPDIRRGLPHGPSARSAPCRPTVMASRVRPYIHLVDGGVSDNVGLRGVLDSLEVLQALHEASVATPLESVNRIVVFIVNSLSLPRPNGTSPRPRPAPWRSCSRPRARRSTPIPTKPPNC